MDEPPMEEIECYGGYKIKRLKQSSEGFEWMRRYVQHKLERSGVIPKEEADSKNPFSVAAHIVHEAWRQPDTIKRADMLIELAIRFPPAPITAKRFSLKAFTKKNNGIF